MAFSGNVSAMGLDQVIGFLAQNGLEGVLRITAPDGVVFELYFHQGRVLFPMEPQADSGRLSAGALDELRGRAAQLKKPGPKKKRRANTNRPRPKTGIVGRSVLQQLLMRASVLPTPKKERPQSGKLSRQTMDGILSRADTVQSGKKRSRVNESIHDLFLWNEARFDFHPEPIPKRLIKELEGGRGLVLDPTALLMEAARRVDEQLYPVQPERRSIEEKPSAGGTRVVPRPRRAPTGMPAKAVPAGDKLLSGDLTGIGLAAVLQSLRNNRHTGTLTITADKHTERLYFQEGNAYVLRSKGGEGEREFLHFFLGDAGTEAITSLSQSGMWERKSEVRVTDLSEAEQREIRETFLETLFWEDACFSFRLDELPAEFFLPPANVTKVALRTHQFLMTAIGQMTEWDQIRKVIGGPDTCHAFVDPKRKLTCVREVAEFLTLVDGRHSFDELVRMAGLPRLEVGRVLAELMGGGALRQV